MRRGVLRFEVHSMGTMPQNAHFKELPSQLESTSLPAAARGAARRTTCTHARTVRFLPVTNAARLSDAGALRFGAHSMGTMTQNAHFKELENTNPLSPPGAARRSTYMYVPVH